MDVIPAGAVITAAAGIPAAAEIMAAAVTTAAAEMMTAAVTGTDKGTDAGVPWIGLSTSAAVRGQ